MEYILIFISAIFVNNIVLSQFLGYLSVSGRIQESGDGVGHVGSSGIRAYYCYNRHLPDSEVCTGCFRTGLFADDYVHPGDCRTGADGGDHPEKGVSFSISRLWVYSCR